MFFSSIVHCCFPTYVYILDLFCLMRSIGCLLFVEINGTAICSFNGTMFISILIKYPSNCVKVHYLCGGEIP